MVQAGLNKILFITLLFSLLCVSACMHKWHRVGTLVSSEKVIDEKYLLNRISEPTIQAPKLKMRYQKISTHQQEQQGEYRREQSSFYDALVWGALAGQVMLWGGVAVAANHNPSLGWKISLSGLTLGTAIISYMEKHEPKPVFENRPEADSTRTDTLFLSGEEILVSLNDGRGKIAHRTNENGEIEVYLNRYIYAAGDTNLQLSFSAPHSAKYDLVVRRNFINQIKSQRTLETYKTVLLEIGLNELSLLMTEKSRIKPGEYALFYNEEQKGVIFIQKAASRMKALILERDVDFDKAYNGATFTLKSL